MQSYEEYMAQLDRETIAGDRFEHGINELAEAAIAFYPDYTPGMKPTKQEEFLLSGEDEDLIERVARLTIQNLHYGDLPRLITMAINEAARIHYMFEHDEDYGLDLTRDDYKDMARAVGIVGHA